MRLLDFCKITGASVNKYSGIKKYVATGDVDDNKIINSREYSYNDKPSRANLIIQNGDVIFAKMKNTKKVLIADENNCNYIFSTGFCCLTPNKNLFDKYLFYYLDSEYFNNQKDKSCSGATQKAINNESLKKINIKYVPSISQQQLIVNKIDLINKLILIKNEEIEKLNKLIKSQFVEMFGTYIDNKNNFEINKLEDYTTMITYGLTVRPEFISEGIDLISARELSNGVINFSSSPKISEDDYNKLSEKAKPHKNEILFSKTGTIGYCALVEEEKKFAVTQNAARIVLKDVNPKWMLYYLRTDEIQTYCKRQAKGNAVKDFQIQDMKKIPILSCDIELQNKFVKIAEQIDKQKFANYKIIDIIEKICDLC